MNWIEKKPGAWSIDLGLLGMATLDRHGPEKWVLKLNSYKIGEFQIKGPPLESAKMAIKQAVLKTLTP